MLLGTNVMGPPARKVQEYDSPCKVEDRSERKRGKAICHVCSHVHACVRLLLYLEHRLYMYLVEVRLASDSSILQFFTIYTSKVTLIR